MGPLLRIGEADQVGESVTPVLRRRLSAAAYGPAWR
jgi:hypothetical protein